MPRTCSSSERLLLSFSRKPGSNDYCTVSEARDPDTALCLLCRVFPDFLPSIAGKEILDFGCGEGRQAVAMACSGATYVWGLDVSRRLLISARSLALEVGVEKQVDFTDRLEARFRARFDIVISQNSMEHFPDPAKALEEMKSALKPDGRLLITFGPPWLAPFGSHMHFFTKVPWVHLIFSEKTVMAVRSHFRHDGATRYEDVEGGLNKMTAGRFERLVSSGGMQILYKKYECVKGINILARVPLTRELFINRVSCILAWQ